MSELFLIILAYLIGSISNAVWISRRFFHIDIREYGSGNAGATNTFRVLGPRAGTVVMILDMLKGVIAVELVHLIPYYNQPEHAAQMMNFQLALGLAAVMGHIFPIWADFRGGKGVATLFGMVLAIQPVVALCCVGVFVLVLFLTRYVSLSSILAAIAFPLLILFIFKSGAFVYRLFAIIIALLVIFTHQKNIQRLLHGRENRVSLFRKRKSTSDPDASR
ncbi:MAG: glycerol-3-phosphate 1-O-acyltransferase PlsY [Thermoflavifilum sp.]|uniref:glycerol-3-phosphate 1-O-acyltransferase PlsY n=1 Tax=Thermoflavifilum sp. TaxID=1968839 RepID=UPI0018A4AE6B|nr:glycerol-3-phosphate 1-O-acyltransferase PlsY [Thermoflavifilum sp.]QOR76246.1 MAG: glycerol-3-phosphate 1-O-acyltransferase PlsY [Thermoflavifilum sp.]